ncbi:MAG: non-homologous end-joining DNA ligase [Chitinophagaceae bacterium]
MANNKLPGNKAPFPKTFKPMLATLVDKPFDERGWIYEIKWDGYRAVAMINNGKVNLISRNNKSFNEKFYPVSQSLKKWKINAIIDGEVAVLNNNGIAHFGSLQNWRSEADGALVYYVFDILWLNGYDLKELPLIQRREILKKHIPQEGIIRLSETFDTTATRFLNNAAKMGMEGIMAKKADSIYREDDRTKAWLKIKANKRHEVVIGGFTQNVGSSKTFSSLLAGLYDNGRLEYIGKIGTGFNDKTQKDILAKMKKLVTTKVPFTETPDVNKPSRFQHNPPKANVTWLKPQLVCEVSYAEMTDDGVMRHPSFEGMRTDKKAKEVLKEKPVPVNKIIATKFTKPVKDTGHKTLLNPTDETQVKKNKRP